MLKLGTENISGLYVGEQKIKKAFVGEQLVFEDNPTYTVYFYAVDEEDSSKVLNSSSFTVNPGESVSVNPWDINGYNFAGWYDESGNLVSSGSSFSVTPTGDATYYLKYYEYYTLLVSASGFVSSELVVTINGEDYTITRNADAQGNGAELHLRKNSVITVKIKTIPSGYKFDKWVLVYANVTSTADPYTFTLTRDLEILHGYLSKASRLPAGYTQVDYIVAKSANSFINTGIPISSAAPWTSIAYKLEGPAEIESEGYPIAITGNSYYSLYACAYHTTRNGVTYLIYYGSNSTWVVEKNWVGTYKPFFGLITKETFTDTTFNKSVTVANAGSINGMLCLNGNGVNRKGFSGLKLFNLTAEDNGIQKHELVPCIREADGIAGMYDIIQRAFYTSSGTDSFTAGPAV